MVAVATPLTVSLAAAQAVPAPAQGTTAPVAPYVVGQAKPPATQGANFVDMSLDRAMQTALENNLDLKAARLNPQSVDYQLQSARAAFLPRYTTTYQYTTATAPSNDSLDGCLACTTGTQNFNANYNETLPWHGSTLAVGFTNSRATDEKARTIVNPSFNTRINVTYTQPLLAGFLIDNTRNQLRTLAVQRQIADIQLLTSIENTKANVRTAYWALRSAIEQIEIGKRGLDLANRLFADNKVKVEIGTLAPIDTVQNDVAVANAEQTLLSAEINWRTAELALKKLLANGPDDPIYQQTINPTEQPQLGVQSVDIPAAVRTALANRTDIVQARKNLDVSNLNLDVTKNLTKPQLDLTAGLNSQGQAGTTKIKDSTGNVNLVQLGYTDALTRLGTWNTSGYNVGLNFTLPFGLAMTQNRIAYARALVQIDQAQATLKSQELTVSSDVTNAGLAVENSFKLYQAAQKAREAAERNADAEQTRFDVGMSTNYNVVQIQNQLTTARQQELTRLLNYINAIAEFDRIQKVGR